MFLFCIVFPLFLLGHCLISALYSRRGGGGRVTSTSAPSELEISNIKRAYTFYQNLVMKERFETFHAIGAV
jgi:hypothetical protein